jgi:hypothetical protein
VGTGGSRAVAVVKVVGADTAIAVCADRARRRNNQEVVGPIGSLLERAPKSFDMFLVV